MKTKQKILSFKEKGRGEPVLCISGFASNYYNFEWLSFDSRMIMIENRGMGNSSNELQSYSIETLAQDAADLMTSLNIESYHVCGISMGGMIAMELALMFPSSLKSLSLLCTSGGGDEFYPMFIADDESYKDLYQQSDEYIADTIVKRSIYDQKKFEVVKNLRMSFRANPKEVLKQKYAVENYLKLKRPLENIKCPTLILSGTNDRLVNPLNSRVLNEKIPNSKLEYIPETDHLFFLEKPQRVSKKVAEYIKGVNS